MKNKEFIYFMESTMFTLVLDNKMIIFSGKSAPRKLRKSRIDQANAIEQKDDENSEKCKDEITIEGIEIMLEFEKP